MSDFFSFSWCQHIIVSSYHLCLHQLSLRPCKVTYSLCDNCSLEQYFFQGPRVWLFLLFQMSIHHCLFLSSLSPTTFFETQQGYIYFIWLLLLGTVFFLWPCVWLFSFFPCCLGTVKITKNISKAKNYRFVFSLLRIFFHPLFIRGMSSEKIDTQNSIKSTKDKRSALKSTEESKKKS